MIAKFKYRLAWLGGVLAVWAATWLLLGLRVVSILRKNPQPFVQGAKLTGPILTGAISWGLTAASAYLAIGILLALIAQVALAPMDRGHRVSPTFRQGFWVGVGSLCWFHALLYFKVPTALRTLPLVQHLPMGFALLLISLTSIFSFYMAINGTGVRNQLLRIMVAMGFLVSITLLPHDVFRRFMSSSPSLGKQERRMLLIGIDGLRRDTLELIQPGWAAPGGCTSITPVPATRKAWLALYGADPEYCINAVVMPERSEIAHPEWLKLLVVAQQKGIRTAFVINDSLTPSFGLQPTLLTEVVEPDGGWKYWFTLGYGTAWPAYSWLQNYISPVETSNAWSDSKSFFRDIGRVLARNQWVSAHDCGLHVPIIPNREELQEMGGWHWLWQSAKSYHAYTTESEVQHDRSRLTPNADPWLHYQARAKRLINDLSPFIQEWTQVYPELSGVLTSDHGESFMPINNANGMLLSHLSGMHGYTTDAQSIFIPLHPFGKTKHTLTSEQVFSWFDLRDSILEWIINQGPILLKGRKEGWLIQFPTIDPRDFFASVSKGQQQEDDQGIKIQEIARSTYLLPSGAWFIDDRIMEQFKTRKRSSAIATYKDLVTFNPDIDGKYRRNVYHGLKLVQTLLVSKEEMDSEIRAFKGMNPDSLPESLGLHD